MPVLATRRIAGFLVLVLVSTSLPVRVWLFGACPICGNVHEPILVAHLGETGSPHSSETIQEGPGRDASSDPDLSSTSESPVPDSESPDSAPEQAVDGCFPPFPFLATASVPLTDRTMPAVGSVVLQANPAICPVPVGALIRPPRF